MPGLLDLPTELLLSISKCLEYETDVNGFSQVNHFLYDLVNPQLYRHDAFDHDSALDWAAQHGKEACVRRLLKAGVPPDWGMEEWQPIMLAAKNGHADVVKVFLEFGVDPNPRTGFHRESSTWYGNPLTAAAEHGHEEVVTLLADHGVDLEFSEIHMYSLYPYPGIPLIPIPDEEIQVEQPLCLATWKKHVTVVKFLLEKGCNPHAHGKEHTAVSRAASEDLDIFKMFIEARPDLKLTEYDPNPLEAAVEGHNVAAAKFLLAEEPHLVPSDLGGFELFEIAASQSLEVAESILERIDVEGAIRKGDSMECECLVLGAASAGYEDLMKRLKEAGCLGQQTPGRELNIPLSFAIRKGRVGMVKLLLDYGANPNGRVLHPLDQVLLSPFPLSEERSDIVKVLRQRGSVLRRGCEPFDGYFSDSKCARFRSLNVFHVMLEECRDMDEDKIDEILLDSVEREEGAFEIALAHFKIELQPGREAYQEMLVRAAAHADVPVLKRFLDAGFDVNSRELDYDDPYDFPRLSLLGLVVTGQHDDERVRQAANFLVERGADIEGLDETGQTSSLFMLVSISNEFEASTSKGVKLLLDLGANPFFINEDGDTALTEAAELSDISIVKVLVEFFEKQGDAAFQQVKESVVRAATTTPSPQISKLLWHYYWPRVYPCP